MKFDTEKFCKLLGSYNLSFAQQQELLISIPYLISSWFYGDAMSYDYTDVKEAASINPARLTSKEGYKYQIILMDLVSKLQKPPKCTLYRAIVVHENLKRGKFALLNPGKNILSSWTDDIQVADDFLKNISKRHKPFAYVISSSTLSKEIKTNWELLEEFLRTLARESDNLVKRYDLQDDDDIDEFYGAITDAKNTINRYKSQREFICYIPSRKKVFIERKMYVFDGGLINEEDELLKQLRVGELEPDNFRRYVFNHYYDDNIQYLSEGGKSLLQAAIASNQSSFKAFLKTIKLPEFADKEFLKGDPKDKEYSNLYKDRRRLAVFLNNIYTVSRFLNGKPVPASSLTTIAFRNALYLDDRLRAIYYIINSYLTENEVSSSGYSRARLKNFIKVCKDEKTFIELGKRLIAVRRSLPPNINKLLEELRELSY